MIDRQLLTHLFQTITNVTSFKVSRVGGSKELVTLLLFGTGASTSVLSIKKRDTKLSAAAFYRRFLG